MLENNFLRQQGALSRTETDGDIACHAEACVATASPSQARDRGR